MPTMPIKKADEVMPWALVSSCSIKHCMHWCNFQSLARKAKLLEDFAEEGMDEDWAYDCKWRSDSLTACLAVSSGHILLKHHCTTRVDQHPFGVNWIKMGSMCMAQVKARRAWVWAAGCVKTEGQQVTLNLQESASMSCSMKNKEMVQPKKDMCLP